MCRTRSKISAAVRVASYGELDRLEAACGSDEIELFASLADRIANTKGKEKTAAKAEFSATYGEPYKPSLPPPEPLPPRIGLWQGYHRPNRTKKSVIANTYFERELLIFKIFEGPSLSIERGLSLTRALRDKAMRASPLQPPPEWLSGRAEDGAPSMVPHAAFVPLLFANSKWADGHIMGVAIALPLGISAAERGECFGPLLVDQNSGQMQSIHFSLRGGELPDLEIALNQEPSPPITLSNATWTRPSRCWSSVTPVVLDRFPKSLKSENQSKWLDDVRRIVAKSCEWSGLPIPMHIEISTTAFVRGIPRAKTKQRRQRHRQSAKSSLGDGFPSYALSKELAPRPQCHVRLEFESRVTGPVIIGAGRFSGYGLCLPIPD